MGALTLASIGTTHPWNIAGIGLDARVAQRLEARHVMIVAGVSAQGDSERRATAVDPEMIAAQLRAIRAAQPDAYRIGALLSPQSVEAVAAGLEGVDVPIVCGGAQVRVGDMVVGSDDGVLVLPASRVDEVLYQLEELEEIERTLQAAIVGGRPLREIEGLPGRTKKLRAQAVA